MTKQEAADYERLVDKAISMFDLPGGRYLWANAEQVDGEWAVVVRLGQEDA